MAQKTTDSTHFGKYCWLMSDVLGKWGQQGKVRSEAVRGEEKGRRCPRCTTKTLEMYKDIRNYCCVLLTSGAYTFHTAPAAL